MYRVDPRKLSAYLLAETSPEAASKRRFFVAIGFRLDDAEALSAALIAHPSVAALERVVPDAGYGEKRVFRCEMPPAPDGKAYCIRTVWMARDGAFWFVTAYPQRRR